MADLSSLTVPKVPNKLCQNGAFAMALVRSERCRVCEVMR